MMIRLASATALSATIIMFATAPLSSQSTGKLPAFEVASVKPNKSGDPARSNFPLGPGDVYVPNGGLFAASNFPLATYIFFAYKIKGNQAQYLLPQLPAWVTSERFDIQARAEGAPGKDDMRLMMRSLLSDRFKLALHSETRQVPVLALVLLKPGKTGPQLRQHADDSAPCQTVVPPASQQDPARTPLPSQTVAGGFPTLCNGILGLPPSELGRMRIGARNVTLGFLADSLSSWPEAGRPMVDQTGLSGTFDFILEWVPERSSTGPPGVELPAETAGPTFDEALREQLGLRMESQKAPVDVIVVDHVERPGEN